MNLGKPLARPPRLRAGDSVAVVAPSGPLVAERLERGVAVLESWGLRVRVGRHALARDPKFPHLAGDDMQRAEDFEAAWCDPAVRAVLVGRGGSGAARIIDLLDWSRIRDAGPKTLVGFSDVTSLHQAVAAFLGLVTLFGPMPATVAFGGQDPEKDTIDHLRRTLFEPESVQCLTGPQTRCVVPGAVDGVLVGGTLSLISASVGSPELRPATGGLAMLEDVAEPAYRLDNHLTQLLRTGWFDGVRGIVLGSWADCADGAADLVAARLRPLNVPLVTGMPFGHGASSITLPLGALASLDAAAGTVKLAEPALAWPRPETSGTG